MQLTLHTDYALRILLYLGAHPGEVVPTSAIAKAYGVSSNHVAKVSKELTLKGYVHASRGHTGGLSLARKPADILVGEVVRETEPHANLLECFDLATNTCRIASACRLRGVAIEARDAFFAVLDRYTLADILENRP